MREALLRQIVRVFDALNDVYERIYADAVVIECDNDPAGHGVDLCPADPVYIDEQCLQAARHETVLCPVYPLDLDMRPAIAHPVAPLTPASRNWQLARDAGKQRASSGDYGRP